MTRLIEHYTWKQIAAKNKLEKLQVELQVVAFAIEGEIDDVYALSKNAAVEGMKVFAQRVEDGWLVRKDDMLIKFPKFDFEKRYKISIDKQPTGTLILLNEFVGFDYKKQMVNVRDYRECKLAYAILEPPYGIRIKIDTKLGTDEYYAIKTKEFTTLYRFFLNDFILLSEYKEEDFIIYEWSDDWSNFFDAGKEWWGAYYWTVYNKRNNTIIVLGASETD